MNKKPEEKKPLQLLSIVIPVHNEEECICSTIEHLHLELFLREVPHEIVVIDDGSTDRSLELLQGLANIRPELNPTTIHKVQAPMQPVSVSDERDKPDGSSSVSMRQAQ